MSLNSGLFQDEQSCVVMDASSSALITFKFPSQAVGWRSIEAGRTGCLHCVYCVDHLFVHVDILCFGSLAVGSCGHIPLGKSGRSHPFVCGIAIA